MPPAAPQPSAAAARPLVRTRLDPARRDGLGVGVGVVLVGGAVVLVGLALPLVAGKDAAKDSVEVVLEKKGKSKGDN